MALIQSPSLTHSNTEVLKPLERLQVNDGLLITADHWQRAHQYHRQHQSLHYQALHQSGIVWGLGVCLSSAPVDMPGEYRDARWIQVKPGVAIDRLGNTIIVPEAMDFRIASDAPATGSLSVYIVLRYVDPDQLQTLPQSATQSEFIQETFRIDETTTLPQDADIVLCRILLEPGTVALTPTQNVFAPKVNQLDLRDRRSVQARSHLFVQVGTMTNWPDNPWTEVLRSCSTLYPNLQGTVRSITTSNVNSNANLPQTDLPQIDLPQTDLPQTDFTQYDLVHFTREQFVNLGANEPELESIKQAIASGTVLLIEASTQGTNIAKLGKLHYELQTAIAQVNQDLNQDPNAGKLKTDLETEFIAIAQDLNQNFDTIKAEIQTVTTQLGLVLDPAELSSGAGQVRSGSLDRSHPLRRQPFLFSQFPMVQEHPIYLFNWGCIILVIGDLSQSWHLKPGNLDHSIALSRETLRSSHEMGINLLHFAVSHHHLTQLQSLSPSI
jgi:hypothetical protein